MNEDFERFMSLPEDVQQKFWRFVYVNQVIGENVTNRAASGETARDILRWNREIVNPDLQTWLDAAAVLEQLNKWTEQ